MAETPPFLIRSFHGKEQRPPRWAMLSFLFSLAVLIVIVFGQTRGFDFLEWDDGEYVRDNANVLMGLGWHSVRWALTSLEVANWHPLTWLSYQIDVSLWGLSPGPMHLVNVLFHGLNSLLVGLLLVRFGLPWMLSLLAGLLFAVHPLHVESVAWISERKDVLSAFFLLLVLLAWDGYVRQGRKIYYGLALGLFALGLMAKSMLVTVPCLLLILDSWVYGRLGSAKHSCYRGRRLRVCSYEKLPFALLSAACAWLTVLAQGAGGAIRPLDEVSLADRLGNAILSYGVYLLKTVFPSSLAFVYPFAPPEALWVGVSLAGLVAISWWAVRKQGMVLAGWLWFLVSLLPVIGIVTIGDQARADRYMYIPMIGLLMMMAEILPRLYPGDPSGARGNRVAAAVASSVILPFTFLSYRYTGYWHDSETLFQQALVVSPENHIAHTLLAVTYEHRGQPQLTMMHADAALSLAPHSSASANAAISASNAAASLGSQALARAYLAKAVMASPGFAKPYYNLGILALKTGEPFDAMVHFQQAIALNGHYSEAYNNLGVSFLQLNQPDKAVAAFEEAARLDPTNRQAFTNLARFKGGQLH